VDWALGTALGAAAIVWFAGSPPTHREFNLEWLGLWKLALFASLILAANLGAALAGWWVVELLDWPSSDTPAVFRGLAMASIGQAALRVEFTRLPSIGAGITLLGKWIETVDGYRTIFVKRAIKGYMRRYGVDRFVELAAVVGVSLLNDEAETPDTRVANTELLAEKIGALKTKQSADARADLQGFVLTTILKYKLLKTDLPDPDLP
jgi:hypothetical protein